MDGIHPPSRIWRKTFSDQFAYCSPSMTMRWTVAARGHHCKRKRNGPRRGAGAVCRVGRAQWLFSPIAQRRMRLLSQSMMKISTSTFSTTKKT
jgi:hypothetical protein